MSLQSTSSVSYTHLDVYKRQVYDSGRYFTVTGNAYLDPDGDAYPLRDCTEELGAFYKRYFDNTDVYKRQILTCFSVTRLR